MAQGGRTPVRGGTIKKAGGRGPPPLGHHLFVNGHLRCGRCGCAMLPRTYRRKGNRGREIYHCDGRRQDPAACDQPPISREQVDVPVLNYFEAAALDLEATKAQLFDALVRGESL